MKIPKRPTLGFVLQLYINSPKFARLKPRSQKDYERCCHTILNTKVGHAMLKNVHIEKITAGMLTQAYEKWLNTIGERQALYCKQVLSVAWRYAMTRDIVIHNPVAAIQTVTPKPRRVKWTREQVKLFLDTAYSKWEWRSMGLIVHMAYDWGQRVGDMRVLTWDCLDLDQCRIDLTQSKRNADVHLPISKNLCNMLRNHKEEFGFQKYVAPKINIDRGLIRAYTETEIAPVINDIQVEANLPTELNAQDLRRTAVTEMMEAGVDAVGLMQVTGHQNITSLKPYMVNTFSGASKALAARGNDDDEL